MALQFSVTLRNARLNAIDTTLGAASVLKLFSGAVPANCAAVDPAGLLATISLPASPMAAAASGSDAESATWSGTASAGGTAASFRVYDTGGTCHMQGTVGQGSGDLSFDNATFVSGQNLTIPTFTVTDANS